MNIIKYNKKYNKITKKFCKQMYIDSIYKYELSPFNDMIYTDDDLDLSYHNMSDIALYKKKRLSIVETLESISYRRDDKWEPMVIVAFLTEIFDLEDDYKNEVPIEYINKQIEKLETRYNIKKDEFNTQADLFIENLQNKKDADRWGRYFTPYDIIRWKYRNIDKLMDSINNNKINDKELYYIRNYYNV